VNGRLTLGENGADNAGILLAFMALLGGLGNGSVNSGPIRIRPWSSGLLAWRKTCRIRLGLQLFSRTADSFGKRLPRLANRVTKL
jgi:hypothetical protein